MLRTLVSPWTGCTRAERKNLAWGLFFLTTLVGSGSVCQAALVVFDAGLSERLLAALEAAFSSPKPSALPCDFRLGAVIMQRLAKPSDYVRQEVLGQSTYVLSWEPRLCPGNPTEDPDLGAQLYGVVCGRGRNPTLRLWPAIFSGEIDVFPSERRNMGQEIGR